jgi:2'-5' RNA ligase
MADTEPASAIVVRVPVPERLERLRRSWDWAASVGVPSHVTVLFPFLPAIALLPHVRRELAAVAARYAPFDVEFRHVGRFPGVVYVAPEPAMAFARLTADVVARFPGYPPYEGAFDEVVPHLTVAEGTDRPLDDIAARAERSVPFTRRVSALEVLVEGGDRRWRTRWRIRLGVRP